jgi:NAD(P)-dependent dehydrogenase (short-subunit alcohol dehydrogenase family)
MTQSSLGTRSTAREVVAGYDLAGKTVFITGGSAGIGYEVVRALLSAHAEVIIAARDQTRGEQVVWELRTAYPDSQVHFLPLNLASLASVRQTVEQFYTRWNKLDVLINNAAIIAPSLRYTSDGFEQQFATNFLGHFLLAQLLVPALRNGAPARVISVTSTAHNMSDIHFDDIQYRQRPYDKWEAYGQSKTADVLFAVALTQHFREQGITANAVMPGGARTGLQDSLSYEDMRARGYYDEAGNLNPNFQSPEQCASTIVWASIASELESIGGLYLEACQQATPHDSGVSTGGGWGYLPYALDSEHAEQLWTIAEQLIQQ